MKLFVATIAGGVLTCLQAAGHDPWARIAPRGAPAAPTVSSSHASPERAGLQESAPSLSIVSPTADTYVTGRTVLRAVIEPASAERLVTGLNFFFDGQVACRIAQPPFECEWEAGPRLQEHQIRAVAMLSTGGRLVQNVRTKGLGYAETVDVDVVQVTVSVTDRQGRFVRNLTRESFRVFEDDVPQRITHFSAENIPLEAIVAVDVSQSMTDAMPKLKAAVKRFLSGLSPRDRVTLLAFNDNIFTVGRRELDLAARLRVVDRLAPWGGTALYDTIVKAFDLLGRQPGRKALVIFTDGDDESSRLTLETATRRVEGSDATLYAIGQGRATTVAGLKQLLQRLADVSGGRAFHTQDIDQLDAAFRAIVEELSNQYLLSYPPPNPARDGAWRRIKVELTSGDYRVRARQGYRAGTPSG